MGLFSSSSRNTQNTTNYQLTENTTFGVDGDNNGQVINGNNNNVTLTDHGVIDSMVNTFADLVSINSSDTLSLNQSSMALVSEANNNVTGIAADSLSNGAYLADSVIASTTALGGQFGSDLAYLTDSAMMNNGILVDKTISTVDLLTTQHQQALDDYGMGLKEQAAQYSADVGFLSQQSIQGNNELTALFGGFLADNSSMLNLSMLEMASLQEQGLDSALEVAGNVALNDNVEGIQNMTRYLALAVGVVGVAWALRKYK